MRSRRVFSTIAALAISALFVAGADVVQTQPAARVVAPRPESPPSTSRGADPRLPRASASRLAPAASGLGFTANALVSANAASLSRSQAEPSIASDPLNRNLMVVGYSDSVGDVVPGVSRSTDGGKSWAAPSGGALLPNPPGFTWGNRTSVGQVAGGDPTLAWAPGDTVYYATQGHPDNTSPATPGVCNIGGLYVYRSTDGGNTWTVPAGGPAAANTQTIYRDKDLMAADSNPASPHAGTVYLVWSDDQYTGCPQNFTTNFVTRSIVLSRSTDGGVSWSTPIALGSGCVGAGDPAVGADGSVYVAWFDCNSGTGDRELVRKSTDGGVTFSPAVAAGSGLTRCSDPLPGARFRDAGGAPTLATDPSDAARVYVAWSSCTPSAQEDVFFSRSTDGGATWSPTPLRVNDDGTSNPRDQFFPAITVDDQGVIRAMWGDDRLDTVNAGGHNYDIFAAASTDHGASFGTNVRVTTQSSDPDIDNGGTFIGDYFGIAPCGTAVWDDTRNGNQDIYAAALDQNSDGIVDDCVTGPPANTVPPTIKGTAIVGATLTGSPGAWKGYPLPAFARQWRRCDAGGGCVDIPGATSDSYKLVAADAVSTIRLRVSATNPLGSGAADSSQTAVVLDVPGAPEGVSATSGNASATVKWTAPADNGSAITGYVVTPYIGSAAQPPTTVGAVTSTTVIGLTNGTTYTFTVAAKNAVGTGTASPASNTVVPKAPPPPVKCVVPNVKSKPLAIAKKKITARHCKTGKVTTARSKTVKKGHVIAEKPKPGTKLARGAKVNLTISRGRRGR